MSLAAQAQQGGSFMPLILVVLLFAAMYFFMIRPQQKRRREALAMQAALAPGDAVVTIGGLHATVVAVEDEVVTVEIAPGVNVRFARPAIARVVKPTGPVAAADDAPAADAPAADPPPVQSPVVENRTKD